MIYIHIVGMNYRNSFNIYLIVAFCITYFIADEENEMLLKFRSWYKAGHIVREKALLEEQKV